MTMDKDEPAPVSRVTLFRWWDKAKLPNLGIVYLEATLNMPPGADAVEQAKTDRANLLLAYRHLGGVEP